MTDYLAMNQSGISLRRHYQLMWGLAVRNRSVENSVITTTDIKHDSNIPRDLEFQVLSAAR